MVTEILKDITFWFGDLGYWGVFISSTGVFAAEVVIAMMGALNPDDLLKISLVAGLGKMFGSLITFGIGKYLQDRDILKFLDGKGRFLKITGDAYKRSHENIERWGFVYIFLSRFIPWIRVVAALAAGYLNYSPWKLVVAAFIGSTIYAHIFADIGAEIGFNWDEIRRYIDTFNGIAMLTIVLIGISYIFFKWRKGRSR